MSLILKTWKWTRLLTVEPHNSSSNGCQLDDILLNLGAEALKRSLSSTHPHFQHTSRRGPSLHQSLLQLFFFLLLLYLPRLRLRLLFLLLLLLLIFVRDFEPLQTLHPFYPFLDPLYPHSMQLTTSRKRGIFRKARGRGVERELVKKG